YIQPAFSWRFALATQARWVSVRGAAGWARVEATLPSSATARTNRVRMRVFMGGLANDFWCDGARRFLLSPREAVDEERGALDQFGKGSNIGKFVGRMGSLATRAEAVDQREKRRHERD